MFLRKYEGEIFALLRIIAGFLFMWHGSMKFFNYPPSPAEMSLHIIAIAGTIEFVGGILIMVGLFTPWVAFIASGEMAYAYWTAHAPGGILPIVNHGELAVLYCFLFLYFAAHGSGKWSIDSLIKRNRKDG